MKNILFVCTGNTCRSPMAEALFRLRIGDNAGWNAASAGVYASIESPASDHAIEAMREIGVDITNHRSQLLTRELVNSSELIVAMTISHCHHILAGFPKVGNKVCLIKSFGTSKVAADISDPFGGALETYRTTRDEIDRALSDLILFILSEKT